MARPKGFEPLTLRFVVRSLGFCLILTNYIFLLFFFTFLAYFDTENEVENTHF